MKHRHIQLPSGAMATVDHEPSPELVKALDAMAEKAREAFTINGLTLDEVRDASLRAWGS